jgi:molybdate transport system ATP-binding protein
VNSEPLIELRHVDVALNGKTILRDVNWSLRAGESWSVVGPNGSGKSTFLRLLRGEVAPFPPRGERIYRLDRTPQTTAIGIKERVALVSPESQERYLRQEWQLTARDVIHTGFAQSDLLYVKLTREQKARAEKIAERLHVAPLLGRDMQTLSTGELRKVLIARALVGYPKILLLDEVCDGLDAAFRREMLAFINEIATHGTQVIYTTHRVDEELPSITHFAQFDHGRLVETRERCVAQASKPALSPTSKLPTRRIAQKPADLEIRDTADFEVCATKRREDALLIDIAYADVFLDRKKVLHDINWQLRSGENWVALGGNGAGKTTFLKLVASELYPAVGARVQRFGLTNENTIWDLRHRIGTVSPLLQTHYREMLNVEQVIASGFFSSIGLMDEVTAAQRRRVRELIKQFGLSRLVQKRMDELSFGELRKVLMLRALVHNPQLLIFDEPFDGLDSTSRREFAEALDRVAANGTQLLIVTHHLDDLPRSITHGMFLERGRIGATDTWPEIREHAKVVELFGEA